MKRFCGSSTHNYCQKDANMVQCCGYRFLDNWGSVYNPLSKTSVCKWVYSDYGEISNYGEGYVMTGACGSISGKKECPYD